MDRIIFLEEEIKSASQSYYESDNPSISDESFDKLVEELKILDPENKLLTTPGWGYESKSHLKKRKHWFPVKGISTKLKIDTLDNSESLNIFDKEQYRISVKLDGISAVAYYENNKLSYVLTRNDGEYGLDITNLIVYCNIPKEIKDVKEPNFWIRGELVCSWRASEQCGYSHPRNMAAGLCNQLELTDLHKHLQFIYYESSLEDDQDNLIIEKIFNPVFNKICSKDDILNQIKNFDYTKDTYIWDSKIPVDGCVIRYSGQADFNNQIVIKYSTPIVEAIVKTVVYQPSSRGRIVPVIEIEPVVLSGAEIRYCSGFNAASIKEFGIGKDSVISITRANEVIPHWVNTIKPSSEVEFPNEIEFDGVTYGTFWKGVDLRFNPDKTIPSIRLLMTWKAPDGVGVEKINRFIEVFKIKSFVDLANIAKNPDLILNNLKEEFSEAYYDRIVQMVKDISEGYTLSDLLTASFTKNLGEVSADLLSKHYDNNPQAMVNDLQAYGNIPPEVAIEMPTYLVSKGIEDNCRFLMDLLNAGFNIKSEVKVDSSNKIKVCVTGSLSLSRNKWFEEYKDYIVESDINKADYLVTNNPDPASSKGKKAKSLGIEILTEEKFFSKVGVNNG